MTSEEEKYFTAMDLHFIALGKTERDIKREREAMIRAIYNEADNGNYTYNRNHIFRENMDWLRERGFQVRINPNKNYEVSWKEY